MPVLGLMAKPEKVAKKKLSAGPSETPVPREQPKKRRRAAQRYGIDVILAIEEGEKIPEKEMPNQKLTKTLTLNIGLVN